MSLDPIQLLLVAKNTIGPQLKEAEAQVAQLGTAFGVTENAAAGALGRVGGMASALGSLGAMAGPMAAIAVVGTVIGSVGAAANKARENLNELATEAQQLMNLSAKTGALPSNLEGLQLQMKQLGIPTETLGTSMKFLSKAIADQKPILRELGIATKAPYTALLQLADVFQKLPDGATKSRLSLELFGSRGGQALIPLLNEGRGAISAMADHLDKLGVGLDDITLRKLADLKQQQVETDMAWAGMWNTISVRLIPATETWLGLMVRLAEALKGIANSPAWSAGAKLWDALRYHPDLTGMDSKRPGTGGGASWGDATTSDYYHYGPAMPAGLEQNNAMEAMLEQYFKKAGKASGIPSPSISDYIFSAGSAGAPATGLRQTEEDPQKVLNALIKVREIFKTATPVALKFSEAMALQIAKHNVFTTAVNASADSVRNFSQEIATGTATIGDAFRQLIGGILQQIAEAAMSQGIGLGLTALGTFIGGPVGGFLGGVGGKLSGQSASAGTTVIHVNALSAKDILRSSTSRSGEINLANQMLATRSRLP